MSIGAADDFDEMISKIMQERIRDVVAREQGKKTSTDIVVLENLKRKIEDTTDMNTKKLTKKLKFLKKKPDLAQF